ncbi:hypothetical protein ACVWZL_006838 [Bradyrhizobium sp. GM2.4]
MDRPDSRAGEHGIGGFRNHGQVDRDGVAFLHTVTFQDIRETTDLIVQLRVGDVPGFGGIVALPDDRDLTGTPGKMPVDAVHRHIRGAVLEPLDRDLAGRKGGILHLRERLDPVDPLAMLRPESIQRRHRRSIHAAVFRSVSMSPPCPAGRHVMDQRI